MPRKARIWYPNSIMHITIRGNRKEKIFRKTIDYIVYKKILIECLEHFNNEYEILSYVLMSNHVHLQIKTHELHIGMFMQRLNQSYAKYFNNKYNYLGHLFQERYLSKIIDSDAYLIELSRYIHLNPVRARMVKSAELYRWSSYQIYIGKKKEKFINSDLILSWCKEKNNNNPNEVYKNYVEKIFHNSTGDCH